MEAMWTYAFVAFFIALITEGGQPSFPAVLLVVFLSFAISRVLQNSDLSLGIIRVWGTLLSFLLFYMIVRVDFFGDWRFWDFDWANSLFYNAEETLRDRGPVIVGVPLLWVFWLRGILRGQQQLGWENVLGTFGIGVLILATVLVFAGMTDAPALVGQLAIPYVAVGLIAIALAHSARAEDEAGKPFSTTWLAAIGGSIIVLGGIAAGLALFDLGAATAGARSAAESGSSAAGDAIRFVAWPFLMALEYLFIATRWLLYLILGTPDPQPRELPDELQQCITSLLGAGLTTDEARARCLQEAPETRQLPAWAQLGVRIMVTTVVVGALLLLTALLFARFRKRDQLSELKESVYQEGRLATDLGNMLNSLLGRLRPNIHLKREHVDPVRKLYFDMLEDAEERGVRRQPYQTPLELAPTLDERFHAPTPHRITDAFDDVRYGHHPAHAEEARRLREEWEALRRQRDN
jgi:hypothetical protein